LKRKRQDAVERVQLAKAHLVKAESDVKSYNEAIAKVSERQIVVEATVELIESTLKTDSGIRSALDTLQDDEHAALLTALRGIVEGALTNVTSKKGS
jgi:hypothetical protein